MNIATTRGQTKTMSLPNILTYARIDAQNIHIPMPRCKVDHVINEGDLVPIGDRTLVDDDLVAEFSDDVLPA